MYTKYSDIWDLPFDGDAEGKRAPRWFGNLAWVVLGGLTKVLFRYHVDGRENLRAFEGKSGVLLVANHTSFLDVVFMYLACRPNQWVRFMARDTLFDNAGGLLGHLISRVGAFPVKRDSADRGAIKRAARMLKEGEVVGILPEGTRRGKGTLAPQIHSGAAFVARMGHVPILPMTVRNAEKIKQKGKLPRFPKVTIEFGEPLLVSDFDFLPKDERLDGCTWYAMRECFSLFYRIPAEEVDMRALFPDDKDYSAVFAEHPVARRSPEELASAAQEKKGGAAR